MRVEEERTEQEREVEAQVRHESEVKAQGCQEEEVNSMHEESHVSNRHMTWWQNAGWIRVNSGPHAARQVRYENWVGETRREDGEEERQKREGMCEERATKPPST